MSKELEALKAIEEILEGDTLWDYDYYEKKGLPLSWEVDRETLVKIKEALKRNEPMKINSVNPSSYYGGLGYFKCPKCGEEITEGYYDYCPVCGQKVDWSDEK